MSEIFPPCEVCGTVRCSAHQIFISQPPQEGTTGGGMDERSARRLERSIKNMAAIEMAIKDPLFLKRFKAKYSISNGCWDWAGCRAKGYGFTSYGGVLLRAHRVSFALAGNKIPADKVLDHICRNRACVRPDHLRLLTSWENSECGVGITATNKRKTHCKNGHPFIEENTIRIYGFRHCRVCQRVLQTNFYHKKMRAIRLANGVDRPWPGQNHKCEALENGRCKFCGRFASRAAREGK